MTVVSWQLRVGFLVALALIGLLADASSLRLALVSVVVVGLVILVLGRALAPTAAPEQTAAGRGTPLSGGKYPAAHGGTDGVRPAARFPPSTRRTAPPRPAHG